MRWRSNCSARRTSSPGRCTPPVEAILVGHEVEPLAAALLHSGATTIRVLDHPSLAVFSTVRHARAIADAAARHRPQTLLLGADNENAALAARVAARLGTGLSAHCVDLKLERGLLVQTVPGFGGQVMANIVCPQQRPQMATVVAGVFSPVKTDAAAEVVREPVDDAPGGRTAREIERRRPEAGGAPLSSAEVVVAGGFGVGSKERWALVEELAALLHGEVGATRPPVDEGWARPEQMIGASGVFVSPKLYIAAGISGMMHHVVGIHGAKTIVAINSDAKAPIFSMADYGIVGDLGDVLPALLHNLRTGEGLAPQIAEPGDTKTPEEFKAALRKLRPNLYKRGRLVADPVDDPVTRRTVEGHSQIFEAARDPQYQELMTTTSHLTGRRVSRYLSVIRSVDDMVANSRMKRLMFQRTGTCTGGRCAGWAALNAMWSTTWDMDKALGTDYHERLKAWLVSAQERDITLSGALTDPKGNRRQGPSKQADPDMYLRIVKRRPDGIVVRGAKVMICGTAAAHEIFVMPGVKLRREDADYAVSFAIPKDAPGITIVEARHASDERELEEGFDNPVDARRHHAGLHLLRGRVRPEGARLHVRRVRPRGRRRLPLHAALPVGHRRVRGRPGRRDGRRGDPDRAGQRPRREGVPRQAHADDRQQRDDVRRGARGLDDGHAAPVGGVAPRPGARARQQGARGDAAVRDEAADAGDRGRHRRDRLHAVVPGLRGRPLRPPDSEVPEGGLAGRDAHAHRAADRVAHRGRGRAGVHARRRVARRREDGRLRVHRLRRPRSRWPSAWAASPTSRWPSRPRR